MRNRIFIVFLAVIFMLPGCSSSQVLTKGTQTKQLLKTEITKSIEVGYLLYLPENYDSYPKLPLLLFLHGSGERGEDLEKVKVHGPPKLIENGKDFPFIVLSPQCPEGQWWSIIDLDVLLNEITENYNVDPDRIYVTGLSMGGFGTWELAIKYPNRFAAIAPVCGGGNFRLISALKDLPVWVFHGAIDNVVPLSSSQEMVDALEIAGGNVKLTIYPDAGHDSWTETYNNPELYEWFLKQKKKIK
ncbi:MAG: prolyl oligopeptidase family serine peptidase [Ignavibacteria bacterium]|nr:prolyl oligopeptidase family serine peptidase [Ignavibacteria bacterium]